MQTQDKSKTSHLESFAFLTILFNIYNFLYETEEKRKEKRNATNKTRNISLNLRQSSNNLYYKLENLFQVDSSVYTMFTNPWNVTVCVLC